jgi:PIN domain nuclease of toxin-antitoxin system
MKYLLDTCTYLWIITDNQKNLSDKVREIFPDKKNEIYISVISQIEMTIKHMKHRIPGLSRPVIDYYKKDRIGSEVDLLTLTPEDIDCLTQLPKIHSDPFDRLIIAQAMNHGMTILTPDKKFKKYPVRVIF